VAQGQALLYATVMLTVLIETLDDEEMLARTLASLVGGAVDGTIREVIICDQGSEDGTSKVADHSGCVFLDRSGLSEGVARARGEWLLVLQPGARLREGWTGAVRDHAVHGTGPARFRRVRSSRGWWLKSLWARDAFGDGLLISRDEARRAGLQRLRGIQRLDAEIVPAG
jgi:glycosyltransferase involved in cell wall biosynthesis